MPSLSLPTARNHAGSPPATPSRAPSRRDFLRTSGTIGAGALALSAGGSLGCAREPAAPSVTDAAERELALTALDEATRAGASYADVRVSRHLFELVATREDQISGVTYSESYGLGVRALVGGSWGFSGTRELTRDAAARAARRAAEVAAANDRIVPQVARLAAVEVFSNVLWETPHAIDPFEVAVGAKADLLLAAAAAALAVDGVQFVSGQILSVKEQRLVATSEGSLIQQTFIRLAPALSMTAVSSDRTDFQTRAADIAPAGRGWEYVEGLDLPNRAGAWAEEAAMKLSATPVAAGSWDLVLHPSNLWLTIHESIAHPTELDRALGYEANYAGTSFIAPPQDVIGRLRLGPDTMTFVGNRTEAGGCATCGWDDEGVPAFSWPIIDRGVLANYQTTREQAAWISELTGMTRSQGCAYAEDWAAIPFQRMPNVSLAPGGEDLTEDDVIAATDHGILIQGDGSYSIDQQRYNAQFGGQAFWEIRGGRRTRMLRDVAYVFRTPDFWRSLAVLGGERTYWMGASFGDAKGQPGQANAVSHGCPMALFRNVSVINTV